MANTTTHNLASSSEAAANAAAPARRPADYFAIWPMLALLLGELLVIGLFAPPRTAEVTPVSLAIALAVLVVGMLPALFRPSTATNLVGCSAVVLASVLWRAPETLTTLATFAKLAPALEAGDTRLALLNIVLIAPLTLHLSARFPHRGVVPGWVVLAYYLLVVAIAFATFGLPMPLRQTALIVLMATAYAGFGFAGYQFLRAIQTAQPAHLHAAQQARLLLLTLVVAEAPFLLLPFSQSVQVLIPYEVVLGAQILLPLGIAYAITRHDLFRIDAALRRTLDYASVSFGLLVIYFGLTALLTQISRDLGGTWGFVATLVSVIAAAAAFTPLRRISQRMIDQLFYPERLRFGQTISDARALLAQVVQRDAAIRLLEDDLPKQLGAAWAKLALRPSFEQPAGAAKAGVWSMLLTVGGQPIGHYWLGPRLSGLKYAADEQEQLQSLAQQAALALAYAEAFDKLEQLNHELEDRVALRTEHVLAQQRELAAFEERQRLARDLHDSIKQTLFSLGLGLRSVRSRIHSDPEMASRLLSQHEQTAIQAQAELGDLLDHLRTPATGNADLVVLLAQHIAWFAEQHGMQIHHDMPVACVLPEPLPRELAQIAREALQNVLRHSGGVEANLMLRADQEQILLVIQDHGHGFDLAAARRGHGVRSMQERATLLGGTLVVESTPNTGTKVWLQLPRSAS